MLSGAHTGFVYIRNSAGLVTIPTADIPSNATKILLQKNSISLINAHDFANFLDLQEVDVMNNIISYVSPNAFVNSTKITRLNFAGSLLTSMRDLSFPQLRLSWLSLQSNPINEVKASDLAGYDHLEFINLRHTGLTAYPNFTLVKYTLEFVTISSNNLEEVDSELLATSPKLIQLMIDNCNLNESLDFRSFPPDNHFSRIRLNHNDIGPISASKFLNLPKLSNIYIDNSNLEEFPDFGDAKDTLEVVFLGYNQISTVDPSYLIGMDKLRHLSLIGNTLLSLTDVTQHLPSLEKLYLLHNPLVCDVSTVWIGGAISVIPTVSTILLSCH